MNSESITRLVPLLMAPIIAAVGIISLLAFRSGSNISTEETKLVESIQEVPPVIEPEIVVTSNDVYTIGDFVTDFVKVSSSPVGESTTKFLSDLVKGAAGAITLFTIAACFIYLWITLENRKERKKLEAITEHMQNKLMFSELSKGYEGKEFKAITKLSELYNSAYNDSDKVTLSELDVEFYHEIMLMTQLKEHISILGEYELLDAQVQIDTNVHRKLVGLRAATLATFYEELAIYKDLNSETPKPLHFEKSD